MATEEQRVGKHPLRVLEPGAALHFSFWRKTQCLDAACSRARARHRLGRHGPRSGQCPHRVWTWALSAGSLLFPRHAQGKFKPSFPWDPCLGAKPGDGIASAPSSRGRVPLTYPSDTKAPHHPLTAPQHDQLSIPGSSGALH